MNISRIDAALEECERHLDATQSYGTEIEAILTSYVSTLIYSAFEAHVRTIIADRGAGDRKDSHLGNFSRTAAVRLVRSIKITELAGAAAWFHDDCKANFHSTLDRQSKEAWDTIVANRHTAAHEDDSPGSQAVSNLTFRELKELYPAALTVLETLRNAVSRGQEREQCRERPAELPCIEATI